MSGQNSTTAKKEESKNSKTIPVGESSGLGKRKLESSQNNKDELRECVPKKKSSNPNDKEHIEIKEAPPKLSPKLKKQTMKDIHPKPHQDPKPKQKYSSLEGDNWLNDEVINDYMRMVNAMDENIFIFSSYFHTSFREGGFKRVKSYYRKHELLEYKQLFIPVHKDSHWFLITYNGIELVGYDPYNYPQAAPSERSRLLKLKKKNLIKILKQLEEKYFKPLFILKEKNFRPLDLRVKLPPDIPSQNNSSDCGVFLLTMVKYLVMKKVFDFNTDSMKDIRKTIQTELKYKELKGDWVDQESNNPIKVEEPGLLQMPIKRHNQFLEDSILIESTKSKNVDLESLSDLEQVFELTNSEEQEPINPTKIEDPELLQTPIDRDTQILEDSIKLKTTKSPSADLDRLSNLEQMTIQSKDVEKRS